MVQELGVLIRRSTESGQQLASFGIDTELSFATARDRAEFVAELSESVEALIAGHHSDATPGARGHRLILALHPAITKTEQEHRDQAHPGDKSEKEQGDGWRVRVQA